MENWIEVTDFMAPELDLYARTPEVQLLTFEHPKPGLFIAESVKVITRALDAGYEPISVLVGRTQAESQAKKILERCSQVPVYVAEDDVLCKITGYNLTGGILCAMRRKELPTLSELCKDARRIAVLENVMNPTNVGAIIRSAAALNLDAVVLAGGCSDPLYRRAARVSMGTVFQIPWTILDKKKVLWPGEGMQKLHDMGFRTVAMALRDDSVEIQHPAIRAEEKLAILLGAEGDGLLSETIDACDYIVRIPMGHGVDSLNVAAASAVAFWELAGRDA